MDKVSCSVSVVSSASCDICCSTDLTFMPLTVLFALIDIAKTSTSIINKYGEIGHP